MRACRTASVVAFTLLAALFAIGACREAAQPEVPPLTTATPIATSSVASSPAHPPATSHDAGGLVAPAVSATAPNQDPRGQVVAVFVEPGSTKKIEASPCTRVLVTAAKGTTKVGADALSLGDVIVLAHPDATDVVVPQGSLAVMVSQEIANCAVLSRPAAIKTIVRAKEAAELTWANKTMHAHLDVGAKVSPELYMGRLEGTAPVAEHDHPTSNEILVAIEASGTFMLDGKESRLGPKQIVFVPKGTKHSWKPDAGSKLVAVQLYDPPGPEQRFIALAAAAQDAGAPDANAPKR